MIGQVCQWVTEAQGTGRVRSLRLVECGLRGEGEVTTSSGVRSEGGG